MAKAHHIFYEMLDNKGRLCIRLEHQNSLVRVGWSINDGNTFGVKYD